MNVFGRALQMARRRASTPRAAPPDLGTPETRARLTPPPWADWPRELQEAASDIDLAVRLRAGRSLAQAQDPGRVPGPQGDWSARERAIVRRYLGWCALMRAVGWGGDIADVLTVVVDGAPVGDRWLLAAALRLYAHGRMLT